MAAVSISAGRVPGNAPAVLVEGVDLGGDGLVLVSDHAVGHARLGHRSMEDDRAMRQWPESHAPVDGLGGQGVAELVRMDRADAGLLRCGGHDAMHRAPTHGRVLVGHQALLGPDVLAVGRRPGGQELDQVWVQRDEAVVAQLADGDAQP